MRYLSAVHVRAGPFLGEGHDGALVQTTADSAEACRSAQLQRRINRVETGEGEKGNRLELLREEEGQ